MSELTMAMLFSADEITNIQDFCAEKTISLHDLIRMCVLDQLYR
jgi:hypothetical protein